MGEPLVVTASEQVRASGALLGAGAYDASNPILVTRHSVQVELHVDYTLSAAPSVIGQPKFKVMVSDLDTGGIATFRERTIQDTAFVVTGNEALSPLYIDAIKFPVPPTSAKSGKTFIVEVAGARRMMFLFAEFGDVANVGICAATATMLSVDQ